MQLNEEREREKMRVRMYALKRLRYLENFRNKIQRTLVV